MPSVDKDVEQWEPSNTIGWSITWYNYFEKNVQQLQVVPVVKNPPAIAGETRDTGSIPGLGKSPEGENGNPLQYSCLENPADRGA